MAQCAIRQEMFTDNIAKEFCQEPGLLFISDIRSADPSIMTEVEVDKCVQKDMTTQQAWHDILRPIKSMLKFRLSWKQGTTEYLAGDLYLQAFGPTTTTETRLVPHNHDRIVWDHTKYEEQMFHFNTVTRVASV